MNTEHEKAELLAQDAEAEVQTPEADAQPLEAPKFTVKTTLNASTQLEASRALTPKLARVLVFGCMGACVLMLGFLVWQFFATKDTGNLLMAGILVLLLAYLLYTQFSAPKKALQRWEEDLRRSFGTSELHLTTEFYGLNLAQSVDDSDDITIEGYSALGKMVETEHLLLLQSGRRQWFFLAKDGLTAGTLDELRAFLTERIGGK